MTDPTGSSDELPDEPSGEPVPAHPNVPTAWIDVIGERPWSRHVAEATGVTHQSPQALLVRDGSVVWHASHGGITRKTLAAALASARK